MLSKIVGPQLYRLASRIANIPSPYTQRDLLKKAAGKTSLKSLLKMNRDWVPLPPYSDRAGWDKLLGSRKQIYINLGINRIGYEWKVIKATDYMEYVRSGNQQTMETPYNENIIALEQLFLAELAEGKGRFTDQIINGVMHLCEMTSWALSAHLWMQKAPGHLPNHKEHIIEMGTGNVASLLSWIHHFLREPLNQTNPIITERIRHEVQTRVLKPYMHTDNFFWMAFNLTPGMIVNNWNPWNNFYMLQCFLLMENNRRHLAKAVLRTMTSVDRFINYAPDDGACEEGIFYWQYAAGKLFDYLTLLHYATGGAISIFEQPVIKQMGEFVAKSYIGNGWMVNFADSTPRENIDADLVERFGNATGSTIMTEVASLLRKHAKPGAPAHITDIFRRLQSLLPLSHSPASEPHVNQPYTWYSQTEICYLSNNAGFFLATKGGHNGESHNHNDVGSFILFINATPVFIDPGVGTYNRKTFGDERYSNWTMQSSHHNLPVINGAQQQVGFKHRATNVRFNRPEMSFTADIAQAYPPHAHVNKWIRKYKLTPNSLIITDTFQLNRARQPNRIIFMAYGKPDISQAGTISLSANGAETFMTYDSNTFTPEIETLQLDDPRLRNAWGSTLHRIILTARTTTLHGHYTFMVSTTPPTGA